MKIDIQIDTDMVFSIESPAIPHVGDTLRVRVRDKPVGQDVIHVKVYSVHWQLQHLPDVSVFVYAETQSGHMTIQRPQNQ
jgi:hypothetical protein